MDLQYLRWVSQGWRWPCSRPSKGDHVWFKKQTKKYKQLNKIPNNPPPRRPPNPSTSPRAHHTERGSRFHTKANPTLWHPHPPSFTTGGWWRIYNPPSSSSCHGYQPQSFHSFWYWEQSLTQEEWKAPYPNPPVGVLGEGWRLNRARRTGGLDCSVRIRTKAKFSRGSSPSVRQHLRPDPAGHCWA